MKNHKTLPSLKIITYGCVISLISAYLSIVLFILLRDTLISIRFNELHLKAFLYSVIGACILSTIPVFFGGIWLTISLYTDYSRKESNFSKSFVKGVLVGGFAGLSISLTGMVLSNFRVDSQVFLFYIVSAIPIASFVGGFVSRMIIKFIVKTM